MCGQPVSWWPSPTPQECDSVTARPVLIMFYILTRPSPHYSLKCKSSQQPYMEDEHGLNRWLHLHTCHLSPLSYISIIFWLGIYTAHTRADIDSHQPTRLSGRQTEDIICVICDNRQQTQLCSAALSVIKYILGCFKVFLVK